MKPTNQSRIFISYSHRGSGPEWKARLLRNLGVFERHHLLDVWQDGKIRVSSYWDDDITQAMSSARLAVVLLTPEALESQYILEKELPFLRERQQHDKLPVFPVICEPCDWKVHDWLRATQAPNESNPVSLLTEPQQDHIFRQLATDIATELSRLTLAELPKSDQSPVPNHIYLDKFPLTRGPGLREERLIGREQDLALLDLAFAQPQTAIVSLVAWGGVGKTMLVQHWLQRLQRDGWYGARRVFAWSFYSQGTKEDRQASEDTFLAHALRWFGVQCEPTLSPWDKGRLLADVVARERTLLVLDGIEPLQYPPGPMGGQLRAPGVQSLLKHLARKASGSSRSPALAGDGRGDGDDGCLCLVTTREPLADLIDFQRREGSAWGSVLRVDLGNLTDEAGSALLHHAGAKRAGAAEIKPNDNELLAASREVDGHALTLNLLGRFIARAHGGDIRRRDLVKFEEADRKEQGGTTFKMLAAFENWFAKSGEFGARQLAVLRILGLFDCPADVGCISVLRKAPAIAGLTDSLFATGLDARTGQMILQPLHEEEWNTATSFLADFGLIVIQIDTNERGPMLDCHSLIREHFAKRVRDDQSDGWRLAHVRLYHHLKDSTLDKQHPTLDDLQPLYHAVAHGCQAGMHEEARVEVYGRRILRFSPGLGAYSSDHLGAFDADLSATACFFSDPWRKVSSNIRETHHSWVLNEAGVCLRALGRLAEALDPLHASLEHAVRDGEWKQATIEANQLSELELALGLVSDAMGVGRQSVDFADKCGDCFQRITARVILADALQCAGDHANATVLFREAEQMQTERAMQSKLAPKYGLLNSRLGFRYCDMLLRTAERAAWRVLVTDRRHDGADAKEHDVIRRKKNLHSSFLGSVLNPLLRLWSWRRIENSAAESVEACQTGLGQLGNLGEAIECCRGVERRAAETLKLAEEARCSLVTNALDHLTLGRSAIYHPILKKAGVGKKALDVKRAHTELCVAMDTLRHAGDMLHIPRGLLTRAWLAVLEGDTAGAQGNLDEAWDIAERGPMRLHMADIHLYRARLFFREKSYPWKSPQDDLAAAEKLINDCGYHRRDEELADAKQAILSS